MIRRLTVEAATLNILLLCFVFWEQRTLGKERAALPRLSLLFSYLSSLPLVRHDAFPWTGSDPIVGGWRRPPSLPFRVPANGTLQRSLLPHPSRKG